MKLLRTILGLLAFILCTNAATIDNAVTGDPEVECFSDSISVNFNTEEKFEGQLYVKGHYDEPGCKAERTSISRAVAITIPFSACGVRRQKSVNPRGLNVSATVVISFHPMFITMVDKAYNVICFYMESDKTVSTDLEVSLNSNQHEQILVMLGGKREELESLMHSMRDPSSNDSAVTPNFDLLNMLTTALITQSIPMPTCNYEVLEEDTNGEVVRYAAVGDQVYHKWTCTPEEGTEGVYCMTVHTCTVQNEKGKEVQLLDENGCAQDKYLLPNLNYTADLEGGQTSMVFKFADQTSLFFHCQIRLTLKEDNTCTRSSDTCPDAGKSRSKRNTEEDGEDVDVFSETITIFEIDDPLSQRLDAEEIMELNRRAKARQFLGVGNANFVNEKQRGALCLSAISFGILIAVLAVVLLACLVTVGLLCCRKDPTIQPLKEQLHS